MPSFSTQRTFDRFGALALVAIALALMFVGAIMPTPLYPLYRQAFGFSGVTLTLVYAAYVLGNLGALLALGRLADQIGRRSVSQAAIGFAIASTVAFAMAAGTAWLFVARGLSGFATGLASGAATAWIAELSPNASKEAAARTAAAANFVGCAAGPLLGGLLAQFTPWPLRLPFIVYLIMLCAIGAAMFCAPETLSSPRRLVDVSLRPRLGIPPSIRLAFLSPAVTGFATFALVGFYGALIPSLLLESLHQSAPVVAGAVVCELFLTAAAAILMTAKFDSQSAVFAGLVLLPPSVWLLVIAELAQSLPVLLAAAAAGGISGGLGFRGSLEVVNRIAPADQRSEVVSSYLVALFAGNSLPVIGIGLLAAHAGALAAHLVFAAAITVLAGIAILTGIKFRQSGEPNQV